MKSSLSPAQHPSVATPSIKLTVIHKALRHVSLPPCRAHLSALSDLQPMCHRHPLVPTPGRATLADSSPRSSSPRLGCPPHPPTYTHILLSSPSPAISLPGGLKFYLTWSYYPTYPGSHSSLSFPSLWPVIDLEGCNSEEYVFYVGRPDT